MKHRKGIELAPQSDQPNLDPDHGFKTLGDLKEWHVLIAVCGNCTWQTTMDIGALARKHGQHMALETVRAKLHCRRCYNRSGNSLKVAKIPR